MFGEEIFKDLIELTEQVEISKMDLLNVLCKYSNQISTFDLIKLTSSMRKDTEYVPDDFFTEVYKVNVNFVFDIFKSIRNQDQFYRGHIDKKSFKSAIDFLIEKYENNIHDKNILMFGIIEGLYTRFIAEKPIHPLDLPFPGNLKIIHDGGQYYCPARKNNLSNPIAFCKICLCRELEF